MIKNLTSYLILSFYHGMPQGFYYAFLSLYTSFLSVLALAYVFICGINWVIPNHGYEKTTKLIFTLVTIIWSFLFMVIWRRREMELSYALGTHMEEK